MSLDGSLIGLAGLQPRPPSSIGTNRGGGIGHPPKPSCQICQREFSTMHNYNTHMKSKPHIKRVQELTASQNAENLSSTDVFSPMTSSMQALHVDSTQTSRKGSIKALDTTSFHSLQASSIHLPSVTTRGVTAKT